MDQDCNCTQLELLRQEQCKHRLDSLPGAPVEEEEACLQGYRQEVDSSTPTLFARPTDSITMNLRCLQGFL